MEEQKDVQDDMISVIMPTYNTPISMLEESVQSILQQTYTNFEFLIINDCSDNGTLEYLNSLQDHRICIITNENNLGITASLNIGLSKAKGKYIARMDADDIALPDRFKKQMTFMEDNPDVVVCGTWVQAFGDSDYVLKRQIPEMEYFRCSLLFGNMFGLCHPTAFFRTSMMQKYNIWYDSEHLPTAQDYGMWVFCSKYGRIANVHEVLLRYRVHNGQISYAKRQLQEKCAMHVQGELLKVLMDADNLIQNHYQICSGNDFRKMKRWMSVLSVNNRKNQIYEVETFEKFTDDYLNMKIKNRARTVSHLPEVISLVFHTPLSKQKKLWGELFKRLLHFKNQVQ